MPEPVDPLDASTERVDLAQENEQMMPPLPEPQQLHVVHMQYPCTTSVTGYTADMMRAYAVAAIAQERERCLNEIECGIWIDKTTSEILDAIAAAIRASAQSPGTSQPPEPPADGPQT